MKNGKDPVDLRLRGVDRAAAFTITFEGAPVNARPGESVAMALWSCGATTLRNSSRDGAPRSILCNMGICYECVLRIDGVPVRACMTEAKEGMVVERGGSKEGGWKPEGAKVPTDSNGGGA